MAGEASWGFGLAWLQAIFFFEGLGFRVYRGLGFGGLRV